MAVKKTTAEQPAENTVSAEPAQSKPSVSIYVGPSILGYIQKSGTSYSGIKVHLHRTYRRYNRCCEC